MLVYQFANSVFPNATAEALAAQVSQENYDKGLIYPPFTNIRKISAHIAANVAAKVYELGEFSNFQTKLFLTTLEKYCHFEKKKKKICFTYSLFFLFFRFGF